MKLTHSQIRAMTHFKGPALIIAVPGAGKTTVLLERVRYLIKEKKVPERKILSITFSRQQAIDMKSRFGPTEAHFSTIHSFCYSVIKDYLKETSKELRLIESNSGFSKYHLIQRIYKSITNERMKDEDLEDFFQYYTSFKNQMLNIDKEKEPMRHFKNIYNFYEEYKRQHHYFDFDDMLTLCYEILIKNPKFLKRITNAFEFIQMDEGQDTSKIQLEILKLIAPHENVFVVADDDQSIYSFRGADSSYLLEFDEHFSNPSLYLIEENHRSSPEILRTAEKLINFNEKRYEKNMISTLDSNHPVKIIRTKNQKSQYDHILEKIKNKSKDDNLAILYRAHLSGLPLAERLRREKIPFTMPQFQLKAFHYFILEDLFHIIAFSEDPTSLELFEKIYYKLNAYISRVMIRTLETTSSDENIFTRLLEDPSLNDFYRTKFVELRSIFRKLPEIDVSKKIDRILTQIGYEEFIKERTQLDEKALSLDLCLEFYKILFKDCQTTEDMRNQMEIFKNHLVESSRKKESVILSTVHASKGLEYDEVLLIDLNEGDFPKTSKDGEIYLEEERRLFYVGMTRAKKRLELIRPKTRNGKRTKDSQFLKELKK